MTAAAPPATGSGVRLELQTDRPQQGVTVHLGGVGTPPQPQAGPDGRLSWNVPQGATGVVMVPDGAEVAFSNVERIQAVAA